MYHHALCCQCRRSGWCGVSNHYALLAAAARRKAVCNIKLRLFYGAEKTYRRNWTQFQFCIQFWTHSSASVARMICRVFDRQGETGSRVNSSISTNTQRYAEL